MAIAAQLSIDGSGASFGQHIEEELLMVRASGSGVLRAASGSLVSNPVVALRNTPATAQSATISCITEKDAATVPTLHLPSGGWATLQACLDSPGTVTSIDDVLVTPEQTVADSGAFGLPVAGNGQPGSLAAFSFS